MKRNKIFGFLAAVLLAPATGTATAAILNPVTVDFEALTSGAIFGTSNVAPGGAGCGGIGACWFEDGVAVGTVNDPNDLSAHLHRVAVSSTNQALGYHADSSGIYIRADDHSAFRLVSMDFSAPTNVANPGTGPNDYWEILGFNTALNPNLSSGDGTNYATRVAYQTVANGFDGTLVLDAAFSNINAFWIHYHGYPSVPVGVDFSMELDNVNLTVAVATVPIPAAAWLFGSGLLGFAASARRAGRIAAV